MEMMTMEQFEALKGAMNEAQNDDTPYMNATEDEINVFGNPNKTEIVPADYTVLFAFPNTTEWRRRIEQNGDEILKVTEDGRMVCVKRIFKNVYLSPRNMGNAVTALTLIESFMNEITADGEVKPLSFEQTKALMDTMNHEISDATYELVGATLRIPYAEQEWMLPLNTMENAIKIVMNNPSAVNEADLFFESSLGRA